MKPIVIVNFKTYPESTGSKAVGLANALEEAASGFDVEFGIAVQSLDLREVCKAVNIPVYAQHIDPAGLGKFTGAVAPAAVKAAGAVGSLLNHSECRVERGKIKETIAIAKKIGLRVMLCAKDLEEAKELLSYSPDYIAIEPPELIGGKVSVSTARPELIAEAARVIGKRLIVGAGIKNSKDFSTALRLGAKGILLASDIDKAADPKQELKELLSY